MNRGKWLQRIVAIAAAGVALAQTSPPLPQRLPQQGTFEQEEWLFVQDPHLAGGRRAIQLVWIPEPLQKYCLGKTTARCATIDFCARTTTKSVAMCRDLSPAEKRVPTPAAANLPRRLISDLLYFPMTPDKGRGELIKYFDGAPQGSLDHLNMRARIRARIQVTRTPSDDNFQVLEVVGVPSS